MLPILSSYIILYEKTIVGTDCSEFKGTYNKMNCVMSSAHINPQDPAIHAPTPPDLMNLLQTLTGFSSSLRYQIRVEENEIPADIINMKAV